MLGHGIALALLSAGVADDAEVQLDVRGHLEPAAIVPVPFVAKNG